jgi:hypothetical protein
MARPTIADTACELMAASSLRALTLDEAVAAVVARGRTRAANPRAAVRGALDEDRRLDRIHDGRWVRPLALLDGAVLTHRLMPEEAAGGVLAVSPDIAPFWMVVVRETITGPGGEPIQHLVFSEARRRLGPEHERAIGGPPGWLPDRPGALVHLRLSGSVLSVETGPPAPAASRIAERRLATELTRCLEDDAVPWGDPGVTAIEHVVVNALADAPDLLRTPLRPLGEVFADAGYEARGTEVGLPGTDWDERSWLGRRLGEEAGADDDDGISSAELAAGAGLSEEVAQLRERYDLTDWETDATALLLTTLQLSTDGTMAPEPGPLGACAHLLTRPVLADLVADRAWSSTGSEPVAAWARLVLANADPAERAGARFVLATALEAGNRVLDAERELRALVADDPRFAPGLAALAGFEEDRNQDAAALALLRKARVPKDDGQRSWLEAIVRRGAAVPSPGARLVRKIHAWAERPDVDASVHDLLELVGLDADEATDEDDDPWWLSHAVAVDIVLFERGELERCLRVRGPLLPTREKDLGRSWRRSRRTLLEVRAIRPDAGVTLVDVVTGRVTDVTDPVLPRQVPLGTLLCARLLPDGDGSHVADASFTVDASEEDVLLDLIDREDGSDLLAWVAGQSLVPWTPTLLPAPNGGNGSDPGPRTPGHA